MNQRHQHRPRLAAPKALAGLSVVALLALHPAHAQVAPERDSTAPADDAAIEMSPFTVNTESDTGWVASASLAGSRLNTPLRDTGASISVLTSEFLADLGAIDMSEAVGYAVNIHMTDTRENTTNDNFIMEFFDSGRLNVRGLPATVTRNYYRWKLQTDSYNVDRIEENRGPNSILFGIGSAGGVLNSMTKQASLSRDFRRGSVMFGSEDSYRGTVDLNQRLLDDKLALRVNAVYSDMGSYRHHLKNETQRLHLASTYQVLPRTRLRVDWEIGEIDQVTARGIPAADGVTAWLAAGSPIFDEVQTAQLPAKGIGRHNANNRRFTYIANTGQAFDMRGTNRSTGDGRVVLDEDLMDFSVNPGGPGQRRFADLQNLTLFWEQQLGENTFMEISHNRQWSDITTALTGQGRSENATLYADPHRYLPDGSPNPHAGQMFFEGGRLNEILTDDTSEASRIMFSHEMDFGKWGNYRLAGMGEYERRNEKRNVMVEAWEGSPFHTQPENDQNQVWRRHYVTPGDWSTYYLAGPRQTGLLTGIPHPTEAGRTLNSTWVPFNAGGQRDPIEWQKTLLLGAQARYFDSRLVFAGGFRRDLLTVRTVEALRDPVTNQWTLDHPDIEPLYQEFAGSTKTMGVVGHLNSYLSLFYNYSDSLNLPNTAHQILPDSQPPPLSDAEGQDYGVMVSFFNGRLVARANAFEVDLVNATGGGFGGTFSNPTVLNNDVLNAVLAAGLITPAEADSRRIDSNQAIKNQRLEGYEFNVTGQITDSWQITASYSYTDGFDSEIAPEIKAWAEEAIPYLLQWPDVVTDVAGSGGQFLTVRERVELWQRNAATEWLREGNKLLGNRKHKASFFTRYTFKDGPLKGLFVGGGYRYQSKAPTNFDNNENLLYGKSTGEADLLIGYRLPDIAFLQNGRIQLNVRNLFDDTDPIITRYDPAAPQFIDRVSLVAPRSWRVTFNFEF